MHGEGEALARGQDVAALELAGIAIDRSCHQRLIGDADLDGAGQQALDRHALWQHLAAQGGGGQRRKPRVQRGEDGFS